MTRDLIEAAKAVCDDAERGTKGAVTVFGEPQSMIDSHLFATLRAAVRAAESAPVADTVAVPVATLREWADRIKDVDDCAGGGGRHSRPGVCRFCEEIGMEVGDEITALLPPPPRPEPPKELVEKWEREAMEYAWEAPVGITPRAAYVAALRAAWEAEKGGA